MCPYFQWDFINQNNYVNASGCFILYRITCIPATWLQSLNLMKYYPFFLNTTFYSKVGILKSIQKSYEGGVTYQPVFHLYNMNEWKTIKRLKITHLVYEV